MFFNSIAIKTKTKRAILVQRKTQPLYSSANNCKLEVASVSVIRIYTLALRKKKFNHDLTLHKFQQIIFRETTNK